MRVVELAGPAGCGKTTLAGQLASLDATTRLGVPVSMLRLAAALLATLPVLLRARLAAGGRWWSRGELRSIAYLLAWRQALRRQSRGLVVLDHGPAFRLAALAALGPPMARTRPFTRWWERTCDAWAPLLDLAVWLDAPDDVLLQRIDARDRAHRVRGADPAVAGGFLAAYRIAFGQALDRMTAGGARLLSLDTARHRPDELAAAVRSALAEAPAEAAS